MFLIKRSWPRFSEPQLCHNHIYVIAIAKVSNRSIQNLFLKLKYQIVYSISHLLILKSKRLIFSDVVGLLHVISLKNVIIGLKQ